MSELMKTSGELATSSADEMAALQAMAAKTNKGMGQGGNSLPVLKINYDEDATLVKRGEWVVGQKKDESGTITDEGHKVLGFIPLAVRDRYSLFNNKDRSKNCSSPLFDRDTDDMDLVVGNNYGYPCGPGCPKRAIGIDNRCSAQKVAIGIAIAESGEKVECIAYMKGATYMPWVDYLASATVHRSEAGSMNVPAYSFVCMLGSKAEKNDGTRYFVGTFEKGQFIGMDNIKRFFEMVNDKIEPMIKAMNQTASSSEEKPEDSTAKAAAAATTAEFVEPTPVKERLSSVDEMDEIPWEAETKEAAPKPEPIEVEDTTEEWGSLIDDALNLNG